MRKNTFSSIVSQPVEHVDFFLRCTVMVSLNHKDLRSSSQMGSKGIYMSADFSHTAIL